MTIKNTNLINLNGLDNLLAAGNSPYFNGDFTLENNHSLLSLQGLNKLEYTKTFRIRNNDALVNLEGLENYRWASQGAFVVIECDNLLSLNGLEKLEFIGSDLIIYENPLLNSISSLSNLNEIAHSISIFNNYSLSTLNGLEALYRVRYITISGNSVMDDFCALKPILLIDDYEYFNAEYNLTNPTVGEIIEDCE
jgi:hypothetical protein